MKQFMKQSINKCMPLNVKWKQNSFQVETRTASTYMSISASAAMRHITPRFMLHFPVTGSGGDIWIYGGSSRNVILRWNFSGTPWGGVWLLPGHTMSLMSRPSFSQDFQTPIWKTEEQGVFLLLYEIHLCSN